MTTRRLLTLAMTIGTALVGAVGATARAATLDVPADYATIQACIDAAVSGVDECVVAPGTYHETINFLGKAITLRSSGGADVTTVDATGLSGSVVTCLSSEGPDTVLDGFTITGGTGTCFSGAHPRCYGGGMYNAGSSPVVTDCIFHSNTASGPGGVGGGMFSGGSPTVTNCTFRGNTATYGGGMENLGGSPTVTNCTFRGNTGTIKGGGMYNIFANSTVTNCTFDKDTAHTGGGIYNYDSSPTVINCTFSGNIATNVYGGGGGGMYNFGYSNPTLTNCTLSRNTAAGYGGGIYNDGYNSAPTVTNCTFSGNTAAHAGGGMYNNASSPTVINCILWGDDPDEFLIAAIISFSDVQGGLPSGAIDGGGNINLDPMFVRTPGPGPDGMWDGVDDDYGDLRLQGGSPCIDAGDPAFVAQPGETDLEGHARVLCGRIDMGVYEFGIGDYDCDQTVNLSDFAGWATCMTGPSTADTAVAHHPGCEAFDFDGDGDVDLLDFSGFQKIIRS